MRAKSHVDVAVIGGGVLGCSLLYHLARRGVTDTVLLEKDELASGTTFHSAALCTHYASNELLTRLHKRTTEIYQGLESATGHSPGFHRCGSIRLAHDADELADCRRFAAMARGLDVPVELLAPGEIAQIHPLVATDGVLAALFTPADGYTDPSMTTHAFASGARQLGATISCQTRVRGLSATAGGEWRVQTDQGTVVAGAVVNAAGMWAAEIAALAGFYLPIIPVALQYLLTEPVPELAALDRELPVLRGIDPAFYIREQSGGLLVGLYERECQFWAEGGIPADFSQGLLPSDTARVEHGIEAAIRNVPLLARTGIRSEICGPSSRVPDNLGVIGPVAGLRNFYVIAGFSGGFVEGGAAGEQLAEWMVDGAPSIDMGRFDPRRFGPDMQPPRAYAMVAESYTFGYAIAYPHLERQAGRPVKTSPIHHQLAERGARFAARNGWECPLYFGSIDPADDKPAYERHPWFASVGRECRAVRDGVGILDLAGMAKFEVSGPGAAAALDRLFATSLPPRDGSAVEALMLTRRGGIAGRMTVMRVNAGCYMLTAPAAAETHHLDWLRRAANSMSGVVVENVSGRMAALLLAGPRSGELLAHVAAEDVSAAALPMLALRSYSLGFATSRILHVNALGEPGYELHHPAEYHAVISASLWRAGATLGLADIGLKAWESMALEALYPRWRHDITEEDTPLEAGLDDATVVKDVAFIGREALLRQRDNGARLRLSCLEIAGSDIDPWGDEPVLNGETPIALLRSAGYGHRVGKALGLAYLPLGLAVPGTRLAVEILGKRCLATVTPSPLYAAMQD